MTKWDTLPNETLRLILLELDNQKDYVNCISVNKKWMIMVQPFLYTTTIIKAENKSGLTTTLTTSPFESGNYVKHLHITDEFVPVSESEFNAEDGRSREMDVLYLLMDRCPHVETLVLDMPFTKKVQLYFISALEKVATWHLKQMPNNHIFTNYSQYLRVAKLMQDTLQHVIVRQPDRSNQDLSYLHQFPELESMLIEYVQDANILSCIETLRNSPQVKNLAIKFDPQFHTNNLSTQAAQLVNLQSYPHIKKLELLGFKPSGSNASCGLELQALQTMFPSLESFKMETCNRDWTELSEQPEIMDSFFPFLVSKTDYEMKVHTRHDDFQQHLNLYKRYLVMLPGDGVSIEFQMGTARVIDKNEITMSPGKLLFHFGCQRDINERDFLRLVTQFGAYAHAIVFKEGPVDTMEIMSYALLNCAAMRKLVVHHGVLNAGFTPITTHSVNELELHNMILMTNSLFELSPTFEHLNYCRLDQCRFANTEDTSNNDAIPYFNIALPNTIIGTLEVVISPHRLPYSDLQRSNVFVTVNYHQNVRFFIIRKNGVDVKKVNQMAYSSDKMDFREEQMININITTNTLEDFIFSAPTSNLKFSLHVN